ncbi:hypothetical protein [Geobacter sp. AOG1]|uniref:hypothetical protein n=1 Tax=Geobacter sp. AOG1 TaxID=1566346 RepID=UPI001CC46092|nr:hypothetical protein [Geobacter sp. AOG1]GFE56373.1 lipoprotein [Geobacter sp. AOG1]
MVRFVVRMLLVAGLLAVTGCSGEKGKEQLETARFEEKQHNLEHAVKLYEEIITKYPGTPAAAATEKRMAELNKGKP